MDRQPPAGNQVAGADGSAPLALRSLADKYPFLRLEPQGIFVVPDQVEDQAAVGRLLEEIFSAGRYFTGLGHKNMNALLYELNSLKGRHPRLRLAGGVARLDPARETLYQGELFTTPLEAIYDFTLRVDSRATFAKGIRPPKVDESPRTLDEFVAVMWRQGVRFGLDVEAAQKGLAVPKNQFLRLVVARGREPQPGLDASAEPVMSLEKDLRPVETAEGSVDLRRYYCVFPQAKLGQVILRKLPPRPGKEGRTIFGEPIPTTLGRDISLQSRCGPGTKLDQWAGSEAVVAAQAGFVSVHPSTGVISVTDQVINHTAVGLATGSLILEADKCVQYGGVGRGYFLEGNSISCLNGTIEGAVHSRQGNVQVDGNVLAGKVTAALGDVLVRGRALSGSRLEALQGQIKVDYAENCLLMGRRVEVKRAVNTTIIAEQALVGECVGSGVWGLGISIERAKSGMRAGASGGMRPSSSKLAVPIVQVSERPPMIIERTMQALEASLREMENQVRRINENQDVGMYVRAMSTYQSAKSETQAQGAMTIMQTLERQVRPLLEKWRELTETQEPLRRQLAEMSAELESRLAEKRALDSELHGRLHCSVSLVEDESLLLKVYKDPRIPRRFGELIAYTPRQRAQFEALCRQMLSEITTGQAKERILPLKKTFKATYRDLMASLAQEPDRPAQPTAAAARRGDSPADRRRENRLTLLEPKDMIHYLGAAEAKKKMPGRFVLPVRADELLEGYVGDLSGLGLGLYFDRNQRYLPIFNKGEKVEVSFTLGQVAFDLELMVAGVKETPRLIRVGGFFVNLPPTVQARLYRLKNALEARLRVEREMAERSAPGR